MLVYDVSSVRYSSVEPYALEIPTKYEIMSGVRACVPSLSREWRLESEQVRARAPPATAHTMHARFLQAIAKNGNSSELSG